MAKLRSLLVLLSTLCLMTAAAAADFPERPVHIIVGFAAGGGSDIQARLVAAALSKIWGQSVVVENRPGADGEIAAEAILAAPADGYQVAFIYDGHVIAPAMRTVPYDPVGSFAPITRISEGTRMLAVIPSLPVKTVQDLVDLAKSKPGQLKYGSSGPSSDTFFLAQQLAQKTGIDIVHVPYKGVADEVLGLLSGEVDFAFGDSATLYPQVKAGKLRAIAVASRKRWAGAPDVPTVAESGFPGIEGGVWYGILAHGKTPPEIVAKLNAGFVQAINSPDVTEALIKQGYEPVADTPDQFKEVMKTDLAKWQKLLKKQ